MDADRVDTVTVWLWRVVFFEAGFLILASPYHLDGVVRAYLAWGCGR